MIAGAASLFTQHGLPPAANPAAPATAVGESVKVWRDLERRPLHYPPMPANGVCPVARSRMVQVAFRTSVADHLAALDAYGAGSIHLLLDGSPKDARVEPAQMARSTWLSEDSYLGPALVRARRLDSAGMVRLWSGDVNNSGSPGRVRMPIGGVVKDVYSELRLPAWQEPPGTTPFWREWVTGIYVESPGCYALQVDGSNVSEVIVFAAASK